MIYLDNSATTRQHDRVTEIMVKYMKEDFGNPSSLYSLGVTAEKAVKEARKKLMRAMDLKQGNLYFTSCGTEADSMALLGAAQARRRRGNRIITSQVEHPAVLEACKRLEDQGFEVIYVGVDKNCRLNMDQLAAAINEETILISIMQVNNETGAVMPVDEVGDIKKNALLHTDAVQALGKLPLPRKADMISVSGHKIHGPKGIGALWIDKGVNIPAFLVGGGQESGMRSGTENVPAIAGFGEAAELSASESAGADSVRKVRDYLLAGIRDEIRDIRVNSPEDGCPSVLNISFLGTRAEVLLHTLEQDEIYVSTGSACSSNKKGQSHVLTAMGLSDKEIEGAIRFSFSRYNRIEEMDLVLEKVKAAVARFRKLGSFR
ncbi:cysteine desulfurase [Anaerovorax odorimutans]|uniref:Cysteine desulfurase n=1 Tax=Anaerovorax odorimutans TaxID=109327 RepID=A0ABT1RSE9_9FIRM|nr:cysteine desulfurase family protein [Anaerovorax odorimutans]MCQ4638095.1 cysteine desulfurase [Anaerovorax odorimutans]